MSIESEKSSGLNTQNFGERLADKVENTENGNEIETKIDFRQQYEQLVATLLGSGMIEMGEDDRLGIIGIDGKRYIIPSYESISGNFERPEITEKVNQGFTKLLIIPFGRPLMELMDKYKRTLLQNADQLHNSAGKVLTINPTDPIQDTMKLDPEVETLYELKQFPDSDWDGKKTGVKGRTKQEILDEDGAFRVILVEDLPNLPKKEKIQTIGGREQFGSWVGPVECMEAILNDPTHKNETPLTLEDWLVLATHEIARRGLVIDYGMTDFLSGTFYILGIRGFVPRPSWGWNQSNFSKSIFTNQDDDSSVRVGVKLQIQL